MNFRDEYHAGKALVPYKLPLIGASGAHIEDGPWPAKESAPGRDYMIMIFIKFCLRVEI